MSRKPHPFASADLNDISPTGDENRKGKKKNHTRTHIQALSWTGWHILAHPWRWGLAVCPIWTHIFTSLVSCWHCNVHTSSISGTQSLQLKWYPSLEHQTGALVDSNIKCPQKYLRVWIRARETVGELELSTCWKSNLGEAEVENFIFVTLCIVLDFRTPFLLMQSQQLIQPPRTSHHGPIRGSTAVGRGVARAEGKHGWVSSDVPARPLMVSRPQCEEPGKNSPLK